MYAPLSCYFQLLLSHIVSIIYGVCVRVRVCVYVCEHVVYVHWYE